MRDCITSLFIDLEIIVTRSGSRSSQKESGTVQLQLYLSSMRAQSQHLFPAPVLALDQVRRATGGNQTSAYDA